MKQSTPLDLGGPTDFTISWMMGEMLARLRIARGDQFRLLIKITTITSV